MKKMSLGTLGNTLAGIVGGGLGGQILERSIGVGQVGTNAGALDISTIVSQVAGGGVGGGALMVVVGLLSRVFAK